MSKDTRYPWRGRKHRSFKHLIQRHYQGAIGPQSHEWKQGPGHKGIRKHLPNGERQAKKRLNVEQGSMGVSDPAISAYPWRFPQGPSFGWGASMTAVRFDDGWQPSCRVALCLEDNSLGVWALTISYPRFPSLREHGV